MTEPNERTRWKHVEWDGQRLDRRMQVASRLQSPSLLDLSDPVKAVRLARKVTDRAGLVGRRPSVAAVGHIDIPGPAGPIPALHYIPHQHLDDPALLLYFHGGGFAIGSPKSHDTVNRHFAAYAGVQVISVDYRMAPENPFPAAIDDAMAAYDHVREHADAFGISPDRIAVSGDSAGGNITAVIGALATHKPAYTVMFYPATDRTQEYPSYTSIADGLVLSREILDWFIGMYLPGVDLSDPRVSPALAPDLADFPPSYIATAGFDMLRDEGEAFGRALRQHGVPVTIRRHAELIHGFASLTRFGLPGRDALIEAAGALRAGLSLYPSRR